MQFPHLEDTKFPNLVNVNVYQFQNTFDYTRWNEKTKIKLCNVLWNSDYADVVKFDSNSERDSWFDGLSESWVLELKTSARIVPDGSVKLPLPYDVLARYNYLYIDMPIITSSSTPLDYETTDGIRRWYFFIQNIEYLSPNATNVYLVLDVWTNFHNNISIPYMLLERGHAPVAYSDVEEYLKNPIFNNKYLLAPDVNYDNAGITRSCDYVPFGNGKKWVCFATTVSPDLFTTLGSVKDSSSYAEGGAITYSDVNVRYGHQLKVNGYSFGNGKDYSNASTPAKVGFSNGLIANNLCVYAIAAKECYGNGTFFKDIVSKCPQFLTTVKACFVVDDACITRTTTHTLAGHTVYECEGRSSTLLEKALTVNDFDYPEELQRFAKLYTAPYAQLEITDNDGNTFDINIEETSTLSVKSIVSIAFPYINERVYIDGIGGVGSRSYSWVDLKERSKTLNMPNSDWFKYCFDWDIPTYALYMDGETAFMLESFNRNVKQALRQELVNYHNTMRSANTAYENACDQADTAYTNTTNSAVTARDNSYRSADTGKVNADNVADTNHTNTYNNADLGYRTIDRTCTVQKENLVTANATTATNENSGIAESSNITMLDNTLAAINLDYSNRMIEATTDLEVECSTATTAYAGNGTMVSAAISGAQAGVVMGGLGGASIGTVALPIVGSVPGWAIGAIGGAVIGAFGGAVTAGTNKTTTGVTTNTKQSIADAQRNLNSLTYQASASNAVDITDAQNALRRATYTRNNTSSVTQMDNSNATSRTNAADNRAVSKTNADNTQTTSKTNATNTKTTSRANALDTYGTTVANAGRTRSNVKSNSGYTRQVAELNAKEILENGKYAASAAIADSRNTAPVEVCQYGGNPAPDYMQTRGVQIKVKTQSDSAIRQTGDTFARFGYALNQIWNVQDSGLKLMRHFTYWKAREIWVDDSAASNNAVNTFIRNIFLAGVTVWNDPDEIGKVNVYTN